MNYNDLININSAGFKDYIHKNWLKLIFIIIVILVIYIYFIHIYRRVPKYLHRINNYIKEMTINPVQACPKLIENGYKLCDFYIASSYRSFLPGEQYYDHSSISAIEKIILSGARYIELDIYNRGFCYETIPVVCIGEVQGNWHYTSEITFEDCCDIISSRAFSGNLSNGTDPFFLCLNLYVDNNTHTINKIANIINSSLSEYLLDDEYSYQKTNISQVPLSKLLNKLVIFCNEKASGTKLNELINYTWTQPFMRNYSHIQILDLYEPDELTEYNRKNISKVYPHFTERTTQNYNPRVSWMYGCQFVSMNYFKPDENMVIYWSKFKKCSFILKPYKLRFHRNTYKAPKPQTRKVSFAPEQISTPYYSITY